MFGELCNSHTVGESLGLEFLSEPSGDWSEFEQLKQRGDVEI